MIRFRFWRTAQKLAWRDLRSSRFKSALIVVSMAVSIASVSGVQSAAGVARAVLHQDSRAWLGADTSITTGDPIGEEQTAALDHMRAEGISWTLVTWMLTMGASDEAPDSAFITLKAVDPAVYPFYGGIDLKPPQTLAAALEGNGTVVSEDVLPRLHVRIGDTIRVGGRPFRITAVIGSEPDRYDGISSLGLHCILSRDAYERSGLARAGNPVKNRVLLRLATGSDLERTGQRLEELIPEGILVDYREANRQTISTSEVTISFLSVTAFIALVLGAMGVAIAVRQHLEQRREMLAVMRMIGGRAPQIAAVFLSQIVMLALCAFAIGIPLGWVVELTSLSIANKYVLLPAKIGWSIHTILDSAGAGMMAMLPALAQPAFAIRRLRPALELRRDAEEKATGSERTVVFTWIAAAIACAGFAGIAGQMLGSLISGVMFVAALAACIGLASVFTTAVLRFLRRFRPRAPLLRLGLASLWRPGNGSRVIIVAMATGLMMMIATFEAERSVTGAIFETLPGGANLFIVGFEAAHRDSVRSFLENQPGVEGPVEMATLARLRLSRIDALPLNARQRIAGGGLVGCAESTPAFSGPASLTVATDVAEQLGVRVGSQMEFTGRDQNVLAKVVAIQRVSPVEKFWRAFMLDCASVDPSSLFHHAAVRVRLDRIEEVRRAMNARFPTLAVIAADDISATVLRISSDAILLIRLVAWYAIGAGLCVLLAIISASRGRRLREIGILAALGASRKALVRIYTIEFAAIGVLSGAIGSLLACGFTSAILTTVFHRFQAAIDWRGIAEALLISSLLAIVAGWVPTYRLLHRRPLLVLRRE